MKTILGLGSNGERDKYWIGNEKERSYIPLDPQKPIPFGQNVVPKPSGIVAGVTSPGIFPGSCSPRSSLGVSGLLLLFNC